MTTPAPVPEKKPSQQGLGIGIAFGPALGIAIGMLMGGGTAIALGLAIGVGCGITIGAAWDKKHPPTD